MSKLNVTVEINGANHPISDGSWYLVAPCGCTAGVTVMECMGVAKLSEGEAWEAFYERKDMREHDKKLGFRVEVGLRQEVKERMGQDCHHKPRYGHEETPVPDGHAWGLSRSTRIHLYETSESLWRKTALCGAEHQSIDLQYARNQRLECPKCAAEAKRLAA